MAIEGNATRVRDELRVSFERARADFYATLDRVNDAQWSQASAFPKWSVGATFAHVCAGLGTVPLRMKSAREGKPKQWMPRFVFDFVNTTLTRKLGRQYNRTSIRGYFDDQYAAALALLDGVKESEWNLVSRTYIQQWTVQELFAYQPKHIAEHLEAVKSVL